MKEVAIDSGSLPDAQTLRSLELHSRHQGSGLRLDALLGAWKVCQVWGKNSLRPSAAGCPLRALQGTLKIQQGESGGLMLLNSVRFGGFQLQFSGPGKLRQKRPLLFFQFHQMQVLIAGREILSLPLPETSKGKEPFFALIAIGPTSSGAEWLAARGRGGGLALWIKEAKAEAQEA